MAHFHIRYANNEGRFKACKPVDEIIISDEKPTAFPQNTEIVPQSEDSFFLEIWTPETQGIKPVLFWIHGGAFEKSAPWKSTNNAQCLAQNADIIIVSCSYRLGVLGMLTNNKFAQQNCGFHDIITALKWTKQFISKFNGDAENITIGGQSSGAWYAMALHTSPMIQDLFKRTILFSFPGSFKPISQELNTKNSKQFFKYLNIYPDEIDSISIHKILKSQKKLGHKNKKKYNFLVSILPTIEKDYVAKNFYEEISKINKKIFIQCTSNECGLYLNEYPIGKNFSKIILAMLLRKYCGKDIYKKICDSRKITHNTYQTAIDITTDTIFHNPARRIKEILKDKCYFQIFDIATTNPRLQCCHCLDLPFLFSNFDAWKDNKIFNVASNQDLNYISNKLQNEIKCFCYDENY